MSGRMRIRVLHLYDQYLNIYADRGNIAVFRQRAAWRGVDVEVTGLAPGEQFDPGDHDLVYVGGGQDRDQRMIAERMVEDIGDAVRAAVAEGTALVAVCGGFQLLGSHYLDTGGVRQPGVGLFDLATEAGDERLIGNVTIRASLPAIGVLPASEPLVCGFENHAGRTRLGDSARPLGTVVDGHGNDGRSGREGCRLHHAIGTYLHGPLLPRNPELADWLLGSAVCHLAGPDAAAVFATDAGVPAAVREFERRAREVSAARAG